MNSKFFSTTRTYTTQFFFNGLSNPTNFIQLYRKRLFQTKSIEKYQPNWIFWNNGCSKNSQKISIESKFIVNYFAATYDMTFILCRQPHLRAKNKYQKNETLKKCKNVNSQTNYSFCFLSHLWIWRHITIYAFLLRILFKVFVSW